VTLFNLQTGFSWGSSMSCNKVDWRCKKFALWGTN